MRKAAAAAGRAAQQVALLATSAGCATWSKPIDNHIALEAVWSFPMFVNGRKKKRTGKSIKEEKWHANQGVHQLGGNFAKSVLMVAMLQS